MDAEEKPQGKIDLMSNTDWVTRLWRSFPTLITSINRPVILEQLTQIEFPRTCKNIVIDRFIHTSFSSINERVY